MARKGGRWRFFRAVISCLSVGHLEWGLIGLEEGERYGYIICECVEISMRLAVGGGVGVYFAKNLLGGRGNRRVYLREADTGRIFPIDALTESSYNVLLHVENIACNA